MDEEFDGVSVRVDFLAQIAMRNLSPSEYRVLLYLLMCDAKPMEISDMVGMNRFQTSRALGRLLRKGIVRKTKPMKDIFINRMTVNYELEPDVGKWKDERSAPRKPRLVGEVKEHTVKKWIKSQPSG